MKRTKCLAASGLLALASAGCALTSKSDPMEYRHFTPESTATPTAGGEQRASPSELSLALGRISASAHLRERMAYRASANEIGYYEMRRWTERPENYLRRAVSRELFERRGIGRLVSGSGPILDLELLAFEEVHEPVRVARLQVVIALHGGGQPSFERTISIEQPIAAGDDAAVAAVRALTRALSETVQRVADEVVERLGERTAPVNLAGKAP